MASRRKSSPEWPPELEPAVFDRAHLVRYTMESLELEREIIELFLAQLPATLKMIRQADCDANWKLATHTLKGSAAAVGARRISEIAIELELLKFDVDVKIKIDLTTRLERAVNDFRAMASRIYSTL